jgi:hypothetical protein
MDYIIIRRHLFDPLTFNRNMSENPRINIIFLKIPDLALIFERKLSLYELPFNS